MAGALAFVDANRTAFYKRAFRFVFVYLIIFNVLVSLIGLSNRTLASRVSTGTRRWGTETNAVWCANGDNLTGYIDVCVCVQEYIRCR